MQEHKTYITTLPDFIAIQKTSFCWFLSEGLSQELSNFSSILDFTGNIEVRLFGNEYKLKPPVYNEDESKQRDSSYAARIYVPIEVDYNGIINRQKVFIGLLPLMTNKATFVINGCERVIISQIIRSPGIYFKKLKTKDLFSATLISNRGSWLKFEFGKEDKKRQEEELGLNLYQGLEDEQSINYDIPELDLKGTVFPKNEIRNIIIRIDKSTKITATDLLNEMGLTNTEIYQTLQEPDYFFTRINL